MVHHHDGLSQQDCPSLVEHNMCSFAACNGSQHTIFEAHAEDTKAVTRAKIVQHSLQELSEEMSESNMTMHFTIVKTSVPKCTECESRGFAPDSCSCGICGSYGNCTFSCQPPAGPVSALENQQSIRKDRMSCTGAPVVRKAIGWKQMHCVGWIGDHRGKSLDKGCKMTILKNETGYCDCRAIHTKDAEVAAWRSHVTLSPHREFTCDQICSRASFSFDLTIRYDINESDMHEKTVAHAPKKYAISGKSDLNSRNKAFRTHVIMAQEARQKHAEAVRVRTEIKAKKAPKVKAEVRNQSAATHSVLADSLQ